MQPCRFVIVESDQWKEKIKPHIQFNQLQNSTSAAMIFILDDYQCIEFGPKIYQSAVDQGYMSQDAMNRQMEFLTEYYSQASRQILKERILLDSGIFLTNLILITRKYGYDTCPIGAFNKQDIVEILELDKERYFRYLKLTQIHSNRNKSDVQFLLHRGGNPRTLHRLIPCNSRRCIVFMHLLTHIFSN